MSAGEVIFIIIFVAVMLFVLFLLIRFLVKEMTKYNDKVKELNAEMHKTMKHISGLPIAKDTEVEVFVCPTQFVFFGTNQEIAVAYNKVVSVDRVNGAGDPSKQMSDAAVGGLFFGAAGAALGAISVGTTCLVITYRSDGEYENKFIVLDGTKCTGFVRKVVKRFKQGDIQLVTPTRVNL